MAWKLNKQWLYNGFTLLQHALSFFRVMRIMISGGDGGGDGGDEDEVMEDGN